MKRSKLGRQIEEGLKEAIRWAKGEIELPTTTVEKIRLTTLLIREDLAVSVSDGRRVVAMGAVKLNGVLQTNMGADVVIRTGDVLKVGRRKIVL